MNIARHASSRALRYSSIASRASVVRDTLRCFDPLPVTTRRLPERGKSVRSRASAPEMRLPGADRVQGAGARRATIQSRGEMALVRAQVFVTQISALEGVAVAAEKSEQFPDLGFISANRVRAAVGFEL